MGVLNKPNYDLGYFDVCPSLLLEGDGKRCYLETEIPVRLSLGLFDSRYVISPLKEGFLKQKVDIINRDADKERRRIGLI